LRDNESMQAIGALHLSQLHLMADGLVVPAAGLGRRTFPCPFVDARLAELANAYLA